MANAGHPSSGAVSVGRRAGFGGRVRATARALAARPEVAALLIGTAVLDIVGLSASGWANSFYSAAVQAGSKSWWAFLWGASDMAGSITVDKPPLSLWVMALSVRLFGLNSWAILVPQALMGVGTVAITWAVVNRYAGRWPAFWAGVALATTPVATLMFRYNNPDALLLLLLTGAIACGLRATEQGRLRWLVGAGALVGFAFLTKQLQVFLVLPAIAVVYLTFGPRGIWRRLWHGIMAILAMVVAGGWWVLLTVLVPSGSRPWIGGSQTDSFLELTFGYNGFARLTGTEVGTVGGGRDGGGRAGGPASGSVGILRLFGSELGSQASWLIPAALLLAVVGLWALRRRPRRDMLRAALTGALAWFAVTAVVFSFMSGTFHAYYTVALATPVAMTAALGWAGIAGGDLSARVRHVVEAAAVAASTGWAFVLLSRSANFLPWLRWVVVAAGTCVVVLLAVLAAGREAARLVAVAAGIAAGIAVLGGPAAYAVDTAATGHTGSLVTAGPSQGVGGGGGGGAPGGGGGMGGGGMTGQGGRGQAGAPGQEGSAGQGGMPSQGVDGGQAGAPGQGGTEAGSFGGGAPSGQLPTNGSGSAGGSGGPGQTAEGRSGSTGSSSTSIGRLLTASEPSDALVTLLQQDASSYTWVAAAVGSNSAAGLQLAVGYSVMPVGGFNGSDPSPSLAQFQQLVAEGVIHYWIGGGGFAGQNGGSDASSEIAAWVQENYTAQTVDGTAVYDLTK